MSPEIEAGALALARETPAKEINKGDIVSVVDPTGTRVTHRVVSVEQTDGGAVLQLKGDANSTPDSETYTVDKAYRVFVDVPWAGHVVNAASTPWGLLICGGFVTLLLVSAFGGRRKEDDEPGPPADRKGGRQATRVIAGAATAGLLVTTATGVAPINTMAMFSDTSLVTGGTLTALTVPPPVVSCGTLSVGTTRLNWTAVPGATGYTLHYGTGGSVTENVGPGVTDKTFTGLVTSGTFSVEAKINYGSTTWTSVASNKKRYTVLLVLVGICSDV